MKKQWTKRLLAGVATLALALPIAFGLGQHTVKAADDTQTVILTKFGFDKNPTISERDTTKTPEEVREDWAKNEDGSAAEALAGVQFKVYDVTDTYWADPDKYQYQDDSTKDVLPAYDATNEVKVDDNATYVTNADGQITFNLRKVSGNHNAVYVFHEVQQRTGYATSADFMLSLPTADLGTVYVYPKNEQVTTYSHKFKKIDAHTTHALAGAQFKLQQNSDGKFLKLIDETGKDVVNADNQKILTGWIEVVKNNYRMVWGTEADATIFVSGDDGYFGLDGFDQKTTGDTYAAKEVEAPKGYDLSDKLSNFDADDSQTTIENTPHGLLPHTGGAGILAILAVGSALIALAFVGIRKRQARA